MIMITTIMGITTIMTMITGIGMSIMTTMVTTIMTMIMGTAFTWATTTIPPLSISARPLR